MITLTLLVLGILLLICVIGIIIGLVFMSPIVIIFLLLAFVDYMLFRLLFRKKKKS